MLKSNTSQSLHKKAQISPVFKYIFVLVAGSIILIFFIKFAIQAEKGGVELVKAEVIHLLDASLQAFSIAESSSSLIPNEPWPKELTLQFGKGANCGKLTVKGQTFFTQIERAVFAPSQIRTRQMQAWTMSWRFPFRITNVFYLTNLKSKYYLISDSSNQLFLRKISSYPPAAEAFEMDHFPKSFDVKMVGSEAEPSAKSKKMDLVKVNYFKSVSGVGAGMEGSYIKASPECENEDEDAYKCYGTVNFFEGGTTRTSTFIGREFMFGAILSDSYENYECQYHMALNELKRFTNLYATKAKKLQVKKSGCDRYNSIITKFNTIESAIETLKSSPTYANAGTLSSHADGLKLLNEQIAGDSSCEMVF